jgi:[ribosomal protein S5]-alanine N-acetyltransferase
MTPMPDVPVRLRPIGEADLDLLSRFDTDPSSRGPHLASGFRSPQARRRRWEEDGWLGANSGQLAVTLPDGTLAGIVAWRSIPTGGPEGGCLEIGALLFPEHRGRGFGTAAQRLLVEYLFATTLANRLQAITNVENIAEQKALERIGFAGRVSCAAWPLTVDAGTTACSTLGSGTTRGDHGFQLFRGLGRSMAWLPPGRPASRFGRWRTTPPGHPCGCAPPGRPGRIWPSPDARPRCRPGPH